MTRGNWCFATRWQPLADLYRLQVWDEILGEFKLDADWGFNRKQSAPIAEQQVGGLAPIGMLASGS